MSNTGTTFRRVLLSLALAAGTVGAVGAQTKTGTTIGQFLLVEPSARAAGMGNAAVAAHGEALSAFYNPGAVGHLERSGAQFTYSSWLAGITYNHAVAAVRVSDANTLLLSVTALNSGEMEVRTVQQPGGTGERFTVSNLAFGLGYSRRLTDRFSAGAQAKYVRETILHSSMSTLALDFGVFYQLPFGSYLGASVSNFGTRGRFDGRDLRVRYDQDPDEYGDNSNLPAALTTEPFALPILFRVGLGIPVAAGSYTRGLFVIDAFQPSDNTESVSFGTEWTFFDAFSIRGGYQHLFQQDSQVGLTLGSGIDHDLSPALGLGLDYAWGRHQELGGMHRLSLGVSF